MTHQGLTNYATFGIPVVLDNDRPHYERIQAKLTELLQEPSAIPAVADGTWTAVEGVRFAFEDWLKDYCERLVSDGARAGDAGLLTSQMAQAGLAEVNWRELADNYVSEAELEA